VGRASADTWRLSSASGSATLHATLFLRDAFQLKPDDEPGIPPLLRGDVPDFSALVSNLDEREAAQSWTSWFERALSVELDVLTESQTMSVDAARAQFFDPPEFVSLAGSPALRVLAQSSHREALRWSKYHSSLTSDSLRHALRDSVVAPVAWETCAARHVSPARLRASVLVLDVEGLWTSFPRAGVVACSVAVVRKAAHLQECLREAFVQNLEATP
jgi:hypothetical protein